MQTLQATYGQNIGINAANPPRERNRCIEMVLKEIEAELSETANSSLNLADKLRGVTAEVKAAQGQSTQPDPSDVFSRLERILNTVHGVNQVLGNAHNAISG